VLLCVCVVWMSLFLSWFSVIEGVVVEVIDRLLVLDLW